jgi:diguanylate cyclase (GGDEF)-like protein
MPNYADSVANDIDRRILFNMPLRKAVVLFSVFFFTVIAVGSSLTYYFAMRKILNENLTQELRHDLDMKRLLLKNELDKEVLLLKILSEHPAVKDYLLNLNNKNSEESGFTVFERYRKHFKDKIVSWISISDSNYYVNGKFMEKYERDNPNHLWFFEALENKNPPTIKVAFDYLNRQIYDLYINYPVYSEGEAIGVISSRISLFEFISILQLPKNVFIFDDLGVIIGAADEKTIKEERKLVELLGAHGEEVYKTALGMGKNSNATLNFGNVQYVVRSMEKLNLFLMVKDKIDMRKIIQEMATIVFLALLALMLLVFIVFNKFILHMLKPINRNMLSYIKASLLDDLTKLPNKRFFNIRIEDEWNRAVRGKYPLGFLMMDLDKFKNYNDTYGHLEGDLLLKEVAQIFNSCLNRTSDFAARFGGEEFSAILPNTKLEGTKKIAENIRIAMERTGKATISIGLTCKIPDLEDNMQKFIEQTDQKLYEAKNTGRNKTCY